MNPQKTGTSREEGAGDEGHDSRQYPRKVWEPAIIQRTGPDKGVGGGDGGVGADAPT